MAIGTNHSGTITGKLNGVTTPTTPSGDFVVIDVHTGRDLLRKAAFDERRKAGRQLDDLDAALNLSERVRQHLAVLGRDDPGEIVPALIDELSKPEHDLLTPGERRVAPPWERSLGGCDRGVDFGLRGECDVLGDDAKGRVVHR